VTNLTGERLLTGHVGDNIFGVLEPGVSASVGIFPYSDGCEPLPVESIQCLQLLRDKDHVVVYQITPATKERWVLRSHSACTWEYERTLAPEDLALVPESEWCK
jgi:hypothetical protein